MPLSRVFQLWQVETTNRNGTPVAAPKTVKKEPDNVWPNAPAHGTTFELQLVAVIRLQARNGDLPRKVTMGIYREPCGLIFFRRLVFRPPAQSHGVSHPQQTALHIGDRGPGGELLLSEFAHVKVAILDPKPWQAVPVGMSILSQAKPDDGKILRDLADLNAVAEIGLSLNGGYCRQQQKGK